MKQQMLPRLVWLDALKGIGIIAVVVGHILRIRYVYAFHMPLFFLVSGYTFHPREDNFQYIKTCFLRLIVPYLSFLIVINVLTLLIDGSRISLTAFVCGGTHLKGIFAAYWFITVLFGSLILLNFIVKQKAIRLRWCFGISMTIAYLLEYLKVNLFWDIQVIPMALCFMMVGYYYKQTNFTPPTFLSILLFIISITIPFLYDHIVIDMKYTNYGIPLLAFINALLIIYGIVMITKRYDAFSKVFAWIGEASLIIMYMHMFIHYIMQRLNVLVNDYLILLTCVSLPIVLFYIIQKTQILRLLFIGK